MMCDDETNVLKKGYKSDVYLCIMHTLFPILKTDRLTLRQVVPDDVGNVFRGLSHPDVIRYYGVSFDSLVATQAQMNWFAALERNGTGIWWAICSRTNETFYGACGFNNLSKMHHKAEIGFWLLPEYWNCGIMSEALARICEYGFAALGLHRIEGFIETENANSKRTLAKLGFVHEETQRDCEVKNGKLISLDRYAKLRNGKEAM